jgi:hypothetical protein
MMAATLLQVWAQCNDKLIEIAAARLEGYNYSKDFKVRLKKAKKGEQAPSHRITVILNRGFRYKIFTTSAKEFNNKLVADLYNNEVKIASTWNKDSGKHYEAIEFECAKTGAYFLTLYFDDGQEGCGVAILGVESEEQRVNRGKL